MAAVGSLADSLREVLESGDERRIAMEVIIATLSWSLFSSFFVFAFLFFFYTCRLFACGIFCSCCRFCCASCCACCSFTVYPLLLSLFCQSSAFFNSNPNSSRFPLSWPRTSNGAGTCTAMLRWALPTLLRWPWPMNWAWARNSPVKHTCIWVYCFLRLFFSPLQHQNMRRVPLNCFILKGSGGALVCIRNPTSAAAAQGTGAWLGSPWANNSGSGNTSGVPDLLLTPEQEEAVAVAFLEMGFRFERLIVPPVVNQEKKAPKRLHTLNPECTSPHT